MAKSLKPALIGDPNPDRFNWLKNILDREYGVDAVQVEIFDKLQKLVEESNESRLRAKGGKTTKERVKENDWSLIFITDDLPKTYTQESTEYHIKLYFTILDALNKWHDFSTVLINTQNFQMDWRAGFPPTRIINLSDTTTPEDYQYVVRVLDGLGGLERLPSAETKISWDIGNRILREQIRALSNNRNLQDGESHLALLIGRCIDSSEVENVEIKQLGQGKSGASVFRLCVKTKQADTTEIKEEEFVLKLSREGAVWKLESEVLGHLQATPELGHPGYKVHLPVLKKAYKPCRELGHDADKGYENEYIVRSWPWYAVHFDFLGGNTFGEFVDLETALVASAKELEKKTAGTNFAINAANADEVRALRVRILQTLLKWLCENWYANMETGHVQRKEMVVWDTGDAPEQEYTVMPPYKLTGRSKGWIQSFLDSTEAEMGARFFYDWEEPAGKVLRLVSEDEPAEGQLGQLGKPLSVVLSHVHGDLNASNTLLWLKQEHPFLIDCPFYQRAGHALQDFARLEVEIKLALLDRQKDSPKEQLKAFEHTYSQMPIWQEMENHLLDEWDQEASNWLSEGYRENVQLCYELVQLIRCKAREVQQNDRCSGPPAGDFLAEYWPALLYHTVRAIGYPSLSVFKRLLAVYSAGSILTKLNCFPALD